MLNFNFSQKGLWLVSPPHVMHDISRKMFFMLHSINWSNFIVWLILLLEVLGNMLLQFFVNQTRLWRHKIWSWPYLFNQAVLIMTKKSRQKPKYLENEKSIWGEIKNFFIIFKGLSVAKNWLRPESASSTVSSGDDNIIDLRANNKKKAAYYELGDMIVICLYFFSSHLFFFQNHIWLEKLVKFLLSKMFWIIYRLLFPCDESFFFLKNRFDLLMFFPNIEHDFFQPKINISLFYLYNDCSQVRIFKAFEAWFPQCSSVR